MNKTDNIEKIQTGFFARHETFTPRYGWLKKGFDGVTGFGATGGFEGDPGIFDRDDAIEILGVGKNMVRSIRFWCLAFHIIEPEENPETLRNSGPMRATRFGEWLLTDDGWDPYLEDPASLWLLHWQLFTEPIYAPAWPICVNTSAAGTFSAKDLARKLAGYAKAMPAFSRLSASSFDKDASCFTRMYGPPKADAAEEIECPFTHLEFLLSAESGVKGRFRFNMTEKPDLPDAVFLAACFDAASRFAGGKSLSLSAIAYEPNGPGRAFQLSETDIGNRLERSVPGIDGVVFTESYGIRQLQFEVSPTSLRESVLAEYYNAGRREAA